MKSIFEPIIKGHPYPMAAGANFGYRCCVDGKWYNCDRYGNITDKEHKKGEDCK